LRRLGIALSVLLLMGVLGCSVFDQKTETGKGPRGGEVRPEISLRFGYSLATTNPRHIAAQGFAQWVYEQTKGKVNIDLYPNEVLGTDKEMIEMAIVGNLDLVITTQGIAAEYEPRIYATALPFLFTTPESVYKILDGPLGIEMAHELPRNGLRVLAYWDNGYRQITNNKRPIVAPADLSGLKMRVPEDKLTFGIMKTLGANPIPMPFPEVYIAMSRGEIDGAENTINNIYTARLYEVQKYLTIVNYRHATTPLIISEKSWRKLPPDVQRILQEGAVRFSLEHRRLNQEFENNILSELQKQGMQINYPDTTPFRHEAQPIYEEWAPIIGRELLKRVIGAAQ